MDADYGPREILSDRIRKEILIEIGFLVNLIFVTCEKDLLFNCLFSALRKFKTCVIFVLQLVINLKSIFSKIESIWITEYFD